MQAFDLFNKTGQGTFLLSSSCITIFVSFIFLSVCNASILKNQESNFFYIICLGYFLVTHFKNCPFKNFAFRVLLEFRHSWMAHFTFLSFNAYYWLQAGLYSFFLPIQKLTWGWTWIHLELNTWLKLPNSIRYPWAYNFSHSSKGCVFFFFFRKNCLLQTH